jgi:hypothetical protein
VRQEHILVFDYPPKFGKGIPESYNLQVFNVPSDKKERVIGLSVSGQYVYGEKMSIYESVVDGSRFEAHRCLILPEEDTK